MHPVALSLSRRGLMVLPCHHQPQHIQQGTRVAVLVLSRGFSRRIAATKPTNSSLRNISTRKTTTSSSSHGQPKSPKQQQPLHSSAKKQQSTLTLEQQQQQQAIAKQQQMAAAETETTTTTVVPPSLDQLKVLFTASAIPMIGFGVMDNLVMIQAGQLIDSTLGVTMGLATMTAAAAGQVVSDVSGVIFGGSLERFLHRYKLIQPSNLTAAQRTLPICRNVAMLGAVCGVALGCGLGASCLLFMDLEARERAERAIQLQGVLNDMMLGTDLQCESCTIHLAHLPAEKHFSTEYTKETGKTSMKVLSTNNTQEDGNSSLVVRASQAGQSLTNDNATVLCTPIMSHEDEGEVVAVLEFQAKKDALQGFTEEDKKAAKVMARHIAIFMHRLSD